MALLVSDTQFSRAILHPNEWRVPSIYGCLFCHLKLASCCWQGDLRGTPPHMRPSRPTLSSAPRWSGRAKCRSQGRVTCKPQSVTGTSFNTRRDIPSRDNALLYVFEKIGVPARLSDAKPPSKHHLTPARVDLSPDCKAARPLSARRCDSWARNRRSRITWSHLLKRVVLRPSASLRRSHLTAIQN